MGIEKEEKYDSSKMPDKRERMMTSSLSKSQEVAKGVPTKRYKKIISFTSRSSYTEL